MIRSFMTEPDGIHDRPGPMAVQRHRIERLFTLRTRIRNSRF